MSAIIFKSTLEDFLLEATGKVYVNSCVRLNGPVMLQYLVNISGRDDLGFPLMLTAICKEVVVHDEPSRTRALAYQSLVVEHVRELLAGHGLPVSDGGYATEEWVLGYVPMPAMEGEVTP